MNFQSPPIRVSHLSKSYKRKSLEPFQAVRNISFEVQFGECFGLLGPNGAGKSTTIQCITGFYPPTTGTVEILGINVTENPKDGRRNLGVCSQDDTLDSDFNVFDQMVRHATFFRIPLNEAKDRAEVLLSKFSLSDKRSDPVEALSGGMRRRLQVARALVSNPKVLVLDEPTTGLDPEARRVLWEIISECRSQGMGILLSTHYMEEAERLCDRIAIMAHGKILDLASPQELIKKHISTPRISEEIRPGVVWERPANLEDVYLKLTGMTLSGKGVSDG